MAINRNCMKMYMERSRIHGIQRNKGDTMGRKCILVDREKFTNAINDYCQHKITMAVACKKAGMSEPTFRKYLRMCWLGQPLPEELFERKK